MTKNPEMFKEASFPTESDLLQTIAAVELSEKARKIHSIESIKTALLLRYDEGEENGWPEDNILEYRKVKQKLLLLSQGKKKSGDVYDYVWTVDNSTYDPKKLIS